MICKYFLPFHKLNFHNEIKDELASKQMSVAK